MLLVDDFMGELYLISFRDHLLTMFLSLSISITDFFLTKDMLTHSFNQ